MMLGACGEDKQPHTSSEMPIVHARHDDACVLVRDDRLVAHRAALNVSAGLGELCDLVPTAVVDEELAVAHLFFSPCIFPLVALGLIAAVDEMGTVVE